MKTVLIILGALVVGFGAGFIIQSDSKVISEVETPEEEVVVTNFEECIAAGNPALESYPRQCIHEEKNFVEEIIEPITEPPVIEDESEGVVYCDKTNRPEACTMQYEPVCGLVEVQCITTPCNPVPQTFGNGCGACSNQNVVSYTEGECSI